MERTRNETSFTRSNAETPCLPIVRKAREPTVGTNSVARSRSRTGSQVSPGCSRHGGRRYMAYGTEFARHASNAFLVMRAANGCVASSTARISLADNHSERPSAPPNPPMRTSPSGHRGSRTRPASDVTTSRSAEPANREAITRPSPVPPSRSTRRRVPVGVSVCFSHAPPSRDSCPGILQQSTLGRRSQRPSS